MTIMSLRVEEHRVEVREIEGEPDLFEVVTDDDSTCLGWGAREEMIALARAEAGLLWAEHPNNPANWEEEDHAGRRAGRASRR